MFSPEWPSFARIYLFPAPQVLLSLWHRVALGSVTRGSGSGPDFRAKSFLENVRPRKVYINTLPLPDTLSKPLPCFLVHLGVFSWGILSFRVPSLARLSYTLFVGRTWVHLARAVLFLFHNAPSMFNKEKTPRRFFAMFYCGTTASFFTILWHSSPDYSLSKFLSRDAHIRCLSFEPCSRVRLPRTDYPLSMLFRREAAFAWRIRSNTRLLWDRWTVLCHL